MQNRTFVSYFPLREICNIIVYDITHKKAKASVPFRGWIMLINKSKEIFLSRFIAMGGIYASSSVLQFFNLTDCFKLVSTNVVNWLIAL